MGISEKDRSILRHLAEKQAEIASFDQWGCGTAQIFSDVSPEMHEEFARIQSAVSNVSITRSIS